MKFYLKPVDPYLGEKCTMALLSLEGMKFKVPLGYYSRERKAGTEVEVDVCMELRRDGVFRDSLKDTVNYEEVYALVSNVIHKEHKLIEAAASEILEVLEAKFKAKASFTVRIRKLRPPLDGPVQQAVIELRGE